MNSSNQSGEYQGASSQNASIQGAEAQLNSVHQDLQTLRSGLIAQLQQDVAWLQQEKFQLQQDITALRQEQSQLLNQQQIQQQQHWAKQFAQILAQHLQQQLLKQWDSGPGQGHPVQEGAGGGVDGERIAQINQLLLSLDTSLNSTFRRLQAELNSHQTALSQQLNQMYGQGQQAEAILSVLLNRLGQSLEQPPSPSAFSGDFSGADRFADPADRFADQFADQMDQFADRFSGPFADQFADQSVVGRSPTPTADPNPAFIPDAPIPSDPGPMPGTAPGSQPAYGQPDYGPAPGGSSGPAAAPQRTTSRIRTKVPSPSRQVLGLSLAILSVLTLGLQYVLTQALFQPQAEFFPGIFGPEFEPTWLNTLRALGLRMVVVVPLIVLGGRWFYPALWKDLSNLNRGPIRESRLVLAISGGLLFLSQWLLYRSVGQTAAGIGVTLFFVYPAVLAILAWLLMGDRPPLFRTYSMITLGVGAMFILLLAETGVNGEGIFIGLLSGTTFALYLLITSRCSQQLHPLVVTIIQFMIVLGLTLPAWLLPSQIPEQQFTPFLLGGLLLGAAATLSYLFNTFSVRLTGATPTAVTSDLTPLLTILLSLWVLQMGIGAYQSVGVLLVTLGALALGLERLQRVRRLRRS